MKGLSVEYKNQEENEVKNYIFTHSNDSRYMDMEMLNEEEEEYRNSNDVSRVIISWKQKEVKNKMKKQIFGEHYNYNYSRPNQKKMYRIQENRNTEIERSNRILLEKIQSIFKRSVGRRNHGNLEAQSSVDVSMKIRSHSNNIHGTNSHANVINKQTNISNENNEANMKMRMKVNDFVQEKLGRSNDKNGKIVVGEKGAMGELNKGIQIAREEVRDDKFGKGEGKMNRKLVKLSEIEEPFYQKRKRIQTEFQIAKTNPHSQSKINNINELFMKDEVVQRPVLIQGQNPILLTGKRSQQNSQRNSVNSNNNFQENSHKNNEGVDGEYENIPKIVLFKEKNIQIGEGIYDMVMYVEGSCYVVLAVSMIDGEEFKETITMPYRNYQEFYKNSLEENHGNILKYFKLCDGLLEIEGFESRYENMVIESEELKRVNSKMSNSEENSYNRLIGVDEILINDRKKPVNRVKENDDDEEVIVEEIKEEAGKGNKYEEKKIDIDKNKDVKIDEGQKEQDFYS